jgi:hypothetical protein
VKTIFVLISILPLAALPFTVNLHSKNGRLEARVVDVDLPIEKLDRELSSGLSTTYVARLPLWQNGRSLGHPTQTIKITYDLWDEVYRLQRTENGVTKTSQYLEKADVISILKNYTFQDLVASESVKSFPLTLKFSLVIEPISKEKKVKIRKWLAQNQVHVPQSGGAVQEGQGAGKGVGTGSSASAGGLNAPISNAAISSGTPALPLGGGQSLVKSSTMK